MGQINILSTDGTHKAGLSFTGTSDISVDAGNIASKTEVNNKPTGFKNYIINGNFDVWQRGTSQTSDGYGSDDRWVNGHIGSTKTHSQINSGDTERLLFNSNKFSRTVVSSVAGAGNLIIKGQAIEDVTKLAGKTVTVSFWARADSNKNIAIEFYQLFGSGGSPSSAVTSIGSQLVSLTSTWQKKTITVTIPSTVGKTIGTDGVHTSSTVFRFWFDGGSNYNSLCASLGQQSGTFDIAQVQLEEGSVATPFEQRPYGLELSLCQRYYQKRTRIDFTNTGNGYGTRLHLPFKTTMRISPSVAYGNDYDLSQPLAYNQSVGGVMSYVATTSNSDTYMTTMVYGGNHDSNPSQQSTISYTLSAEL